MGVHGTIFQTHWHQGRRDRREDGWITSPQSEKFWLGLSPDLKILVGQLSPILELHVRHFFLNLEKIIRRFSSILEIFCTQAPNLSSEKTEKFLSHPDTSVASIHIGCVDVNKKCFSFLISPKNLDTLMNCATSTFVITFFQYYMTYKNSYIKN